MFEQQVEHYKKKYYGIKNSLENRSIEPYLKNWGITDLKESLLSNSKEFRDFAYDIARSVMPGRVSCTTYAAVISYIADLVGVDVKAFAGFCLPKSHPKYETELSFFNTKKTEGVEHPLMATHVYVEINGNSYEYYNGDTSNIAHIDCVEI